jgi:hypothetical protein
VRISMDGRNVFIERRRLWHSLKHWDDYFKGYADGREAHSGIVVRFAFFTITTAAHTRHLLAARRSRLWREGMSGGLPETDVDMTLRLDNAKA